MKICLLISLLLSVVSPYTYGFDLVKAGIRRAPKTTTDKVKLLGKKAVNKMYYEQNKEKMRLQQREYRNRTRMKNPSWVKKQREGYLRFMDKNKNY